ncbi:MAG: hypothetical protein ACFFFO_07560, partial [Candidatus Thorarchaeota archaeon]
MSTEIGRSLKLSNFGILFVTIVILLAILFVPFAYHFDLGPGPNSIEAVVWQYIESPWQMG